ncbi:MAG: hypothetical protein WCA46_31095 [Actinocatenispora sp.]
MTDIERSSGGSIRRRTAGLALGAALVGTTLLGVTGCTDSGSCSDDDYAVGPAVSSGQSASGGQGGGVVLARGGSHGGSHGGFHGGSEGDSGGGYHGGSDSDSGGGSGYHPHYYNNNHHNDDDDSCGPSYSPSPSAYSPSPTDAAYPWDQSSGSPTPGVSESPTDDGSMRGLN